MKNGETKWGKSVTSMRDGEAVLAYKQHEEACDPNMTRASEIDPSSMAKATRIRTFTNGKRKLAW